MDTAQTASDAGPYLTEAALFGLGGQRRADDRAGAGDRGEMVAENDLLLGGDIIDPVFERD